jgi:hypothetical protein
MRRLALGLGIGTAAVGVVALVMWRLASSTTPADSATPTAGTPPPAIEAPAAAAAAPRPQAGLTERSPDATAKRDETAPATADAQKPARPAAGGPTKTAPRRSGGGWSSNPLAPSNQRPVMVHEPAAGGAPAPAPAPDCAHPFFVDSEGIKRLRPECM